MAAGGLRHGNPEVSRSDAYGFDKYRWSNEDCWPDGLDVYIYDDGTVKVAASHTTAAVTAVRNYGEGKKSKPGGHVIVQFEPLPEVTRE
jgi:hypothetical protein